MLNKKKYLTLISLSVVFAMIASSCSLSGQKFGKALEHFSENMNEAMNVNEETTETTAITEETESNNEDVSEEVTTTPEPTATVVPTSTLTPTPTEVPVYVPERVDFSDLTEDTLTDSVTIETEDFMESYVLEDETLISTFEGNRMLISCEEIENVQVSVNLMLDGFYQEALGVYNRYTNEAVAEYNLLPEEDAENFTAVSTNCNYSYGFNGRVLSVEMTYSVVRGEETIAETYECVSFDMYTGSYIMLENVISDMDGFIGAATSQLAFSLGTEEGVETEFSDICIMARNDDGSVYILGTASDGRRVRALVDINEYSTFMSRYGRIVFG